MPTTWIQAMVLKNISVKIMGIIILAVCAIVFATWVYNILERFCRSSSSGENYSSATIVISCANIASLVSLTGNVSSRHPVSPGLSTTELPENPPGYENIEMYPSLPSSCQSNINDIDDEPPPKYEDVIGI